MAFEPRLDILPEPQRDVWGEMSALPETLKALSYFADGDLHTLPEVIRNRLTAAVRAVDLGSLPTIEPPQ